MKNVAAELKAVNLMESFWRTLIEPRQLGQRSAIVMSLMSIAVFFQSRLCFILLWRAVSGCQNDAGFNVLSLCSIIYQLCWRLTGLLSASKRYSVRHTGRDRDTIWSPLYHCNHRTEASHAVLTRLQCCSQFMDCGLYCDALEQGIYEGHQFDVTLLILKPLFIHSRADHRQLHALFQSCHVEVWKAADGSYCNNSEKASGYM